MGCEITVNDLGDVNLVSEDDLTVNINSEEGIIHIDGEKDVTANVSGDVREGSTFDAANNLTIDAEGSIEGSTATAGNTASLTADGSILNTSISGDDISLTADADGDSVGTVGTKETPILVDTASGNTGSGVLSASGTEVYVTERSGNLVIDQITATEGDAVLTAPGNVMDADPDSAVKDASDKQKDASDAQSLADAAADRADILEEHAKKLEAEAEAARAEADKADRAASELETAAQTIAQEASKEKKEAEDAKAEIERLTEIAKAADEAAAQAAKDVKAAQEAVENAQSAEEIAQAKADLEKAQSIANEKAQEAKTAWDNVENAKKQADSAAANAERLTALAEEAEATAKTAREEANRLDAIAGKKENDAKTARDEANAARQDAIDKQTEANTAQQAADDAVAQAENSEPAVETAGNLTIHSGGDVGTADAPLDINVGGSLTVGAPGNVNIASKDGLNIADLNADNNAAEDRDVILTAGKDLNSEKPITGGNAEINTLDGNAGSEKKPLDLSVDSLSGTISGNGKETGNGTITNDKDLKIGDLSADGTLNLTVHGDITADNSDENRPADGTSNITADNLVITADGNIGSAEDPLNIDADNLSASGGDMNLHLNTDTTIQDIEGEDVKIDADGKVEAGDKDVNITADSLELNAFGNVGSADHPLNVSVSGNLSISSVNGETYYKNYYTKGYPTPQQTPAPQPEYPYPMVGGLVRAGDGSPAPYIIWELFLVAETTDAVTGRPVFRDTDHFILTTAGGIRMIIRLADPEWTIWDEKWTGWTPDGLISDTEGEGRILGIFAMTNDYLDIANGLRYLILTEEYRSFLINEGYRWVFFRVGEKAILIDLSKLEETGTYVFTLDPAGDGALTTQDEENHVVPVIAEVWYKGERILSWGEDGKQYTMDEDAAKALFEIGEDEEFRMEDLTETSILMNVSTDLVSY